MKRVLNELLITLGGTPYCPELALTNDHIYLGTPEQWDTDSWDEVPQCEIPEDLSGHAERLLQGHTDVVDLPVIINPWDAIIEGGDDYHALLDEVATRHGSTEARRYADRYLAYAKCLKIEYEAAQAVEAQKRKIASRAGKGNLDKDKHDMMLRVFKSVHEKTPYPYRSKGLDMTAFWIAVTNGLAVRNSSVAVPKSAAYKTLDWRKVRKSYENIFGSISRTLELIKQDSPK